MHETDGWKTAQWEQWFIAEVMPTLRSGWSDGDDTYSIRHIDRWEDPDIRAGFEAINAGYDQLAFTFTSHHAPQAFARLGPETRQKFYDAWMARPERTVDDQPGPDPEFAVPNPGVLVALPSGERVEVFDDGSVVSTHGEVLQPADPSHEPKESKPRNRKTGSIIVGSLGFVLLVLIGTALLRDDSPVAQSPDTTAASPTTAASTESTAPAPAPVSPAPTIASADQQATDTTVPTSVAAGTVVDATYMFASHDFTVVVEGDGRGLATSGDAKWYIAEFAAESPSGPFIVEAKWVEGAFRGRVLDPSGGPVDGATVDAEWVDPNTLNITAVTTAFDTPASHINLALLIRMRNPDGTNGDDYESTFSWTP